MKVFFTTIIFAVLVAGSIASSNLIDPNDLCKLVVDGTKVGAQTSCLSYYSCQSGKATWHVCESGLYDKDKQKCTKEGGRFCKDAKNPCLDSTNGDYKPDPKSCNGFYYCKDKKGTHSQCPNNLNFSPLTSRCEYPLTYPCTPNICQFLPNNVYFGDSKSCQNYNQCVNDALTSGVCPNNLYFNTKNGECDYGKNAPCLQNSTHISDPSEVQQPPTSLAACTEEGAYIADGKSCAGYYYCLNKKNVWSSCPQGKIFNAEGPSCVDPTTVVCPYDRCANMPDTVQWMSKTNDGCHGYSACKNGATWGTGTCKNGLYFDEKEQICTQTVIDYPACAVQTVPAPPVE